MPSVNTVQLPDVPEQRACDTIFDSSQGLSGTPFVPIRARERPVFRCFSGSGQIRRARYWSTPRAEERPLRRGVPGFADCRGSQPDGPNLNSSGISRSRVAVGKTRVITSRIRTAACGSLRTVKKPHCFSKKTMLSRDAVRPYLPICCALFPRHRTTLISLQTRPDCSPIIAVNSSTRIVLPSY